MIEIVYHPAGLRADIYRSAGDGLVPAVVCVHGGAWVSGDRSATQRVAAHLAAAGIAVMAIDFRMGQRYPYPAALQDINHATRWLKQNAANYSIDEQRIGGFGVSSGGHLVLLSALRPNDARYALVPGSSKVDASLAFVVTCSGVLDPLARYEMARQAGHADIIACHEIYFGSANVMDEASPTRILQRDEVVQLPPALFYQGGQDERLPPDTASQAAEWYRKKGGQAEGKLFPALGHVTSEWPESALDEVVAGIKRLAG